MTDLLILLVVLGALSGYTVLIRMVYGPRDFAAGYNEGIADSCREASR